VYYYRPGPFCARLRLVGRVDVLPVVGAVFPTWVGAAPKLLPIIATIGCIPAAMERNTRVHVGFEGCDQAAGRSRRRSQKSS